VPFPFDVLETVMNVRESLGQSSSEEEKFIRKMSMARAIHAIWREMINFLYRANLGVVLSDLIRANHEITFSTGITSVYFLGGFTRGATSVQIAAIILFSPTLNTRKKLA
jgi:hypothetical protein